MNLEQYHQILRDFEGSSVNIIHMRPYLQITISKFHLMKLFDHIQITFFIEALFAGQTC